MADLRLPSDAEQQSISNNDSLTSALPSANQPVPQQQSLSDSPSDSSSPGDAYDLAESNNSDDDDDAILNNEPLEVLVSHSHHASMRR